MSILVTDGEERVGYNVMKSLGKKGVDVTSCSKTEISASSFSRYCKGHFTYPDPSKNTDDFLKRILNEVTKKKYEMIIPVSDFSVIPISENREKFHRFTKIPIASHKSILLAYNKIETLKMAMENEIPCPEIFFPKNTRDLKEISEKLEYPIVIKPAVSQRWNQNKTKYQKVQMAFSEKELFEKYKILYDRKYPPIVQEYIPGTGYGFFGLYNNSELRASFVHRRIREFPVGKGASTLRESVENRRIRKFGDKLLKLMKWHGVAMVEFKMDSRTNEPKLMEVNGRFWGSLNLPISSGIDFPYLLYKMTKDGDIRPIHKYKTDVKSRWLMGDIFRMISIVTNSYDRKLNKNIKKSNEIEDFIKFRGRDMYYDMFSLDDPLPGFVNLLFSFQRALNKVKKVS
ncbi:MAG: ATP-grasp domain-containing protein [Candidatus Aenigmarchaeota archaeon]|nr:ATP-grasp domain-containing protein [Candidatus Aenigmarchaeota archaeon]